MLDYYRIDIIWNSLLNRAPHLLRNWAKIQVFFMWLSEVKNPFWKIKPQGSNNVDTVFGLRAVLKDGKNQSKEIKLESQHSY